MTPEQAKQFIHAQGQFVAQWIKEQGIEPPQPDLDAAIQVVAKHFGGTTLYLHKPDAAPLHLQIQADIDPQIPVAVVVNALTTAINGLCGSGVQVKAVQIETRGLGHGYLHALQDRSDLAAGVAVQPLTQDTQPTELMTFIAEHAGHAHAQAIATRFGGTTFYLPRASGKRSAATPFDHIGVAQAELQAAYRQRMATVMAGVVAGYSPEEHLEWLKKAELCLSQYQMATSWIALHTGQALPPSAQA